MDGRTTILAIDDDESTLTTVRNFLEDQGYLFIGEKYSEDIINLLDRTAPDLVLLDVQLQNNDGISLINKIRSHTCVPILVISGKNDLMDKVIGLEVGADDYISKPYELRELEARIKANLRLVKKVTQAVTKEMHHEEVSILHFGEWYLDLDRHEFLDEDKQPLEMTPGEIDMLAAFAKAPRKALSRDRLFDLTRGRDFEGFDRAVDVQISRIRQKIKDDQREKPFIKTVRGIGYMLDTDVNIIK